MHTQLDWQIQTDSVYEPNDLSETFNRFVYNVSIRPTYPKYKHTFMLPSAH